MFSLANRFVCVKRWYLLRGQFFLSGRHVFFLSSPFLSDICSNFLALVKLLFCFLMVKNCHAVTTTFLCKTMAALPLGCPSCPWRHGAPSAPTVFGSRAPRPPPTPVPDSSPPFPFLWVTRAQRLYLRSNAISDPSLPRPQRKEPRRIAERDGTTEGNPLTVGSWVTGQTRPTAPRAVPSRRRPPPDLGRAGTPRATAMVLDGGRGEHRRGNTGPFASRTSWGNPPSRRTSRHRAATLPQRPTSWGTGCRTDPRGAVPAAATRDHAAEPSWPQTYRRSKEDAPTGAPQAGKVCAVPPPCHRCTAREGGEIHDHRRAAREGGTRRRAVGP